MPCFEKIHPLFSLLKTQHNTTNISYGQFITYENREDAVLRPAQSVRQRRPLPPAPKNISSPPDSLSLAFLLESSVDAGEVKKQMNSEG